MSGIAMGTRYSHLGLEERCRLRSLMEMGFGFGEIARRLGRHRSTIHREVVRNRCIDAYRPDSADRRAWARKLRGSKIERSTDLRACIEDRLAMGWSPQQIAGRMELENAEHGVSAESIYRHVDSPVGRRTGLPRQLAQRKAKRGRRRRNGRREPSRSPGARRLPNGRLYAYLAGEASDARAACACWLAAAVRVGVGCACSLISPAALSRSAAIRRNRLMTLPVPAGISRPTMTFSFRPDRLSVLPDTAASVSTRVVSWNDAAEMNDRVCRLALVIPWRTGSASAALSPARSALSFASSNSRRSTCSPTRKVVSPASEISTFWSIWRTITSMCLSLIFTSGS